MTHPSPMHEAPAEAGLRAVPGRGGVTPRPPQGPGIQIHVIAARSQLADNLSVDTTGASSRKKICPRCAEEVQEAAVVCRFCGHDFAKETPHAAPSRGPLLAGASTIALVAAPMILLGSLGVWVHEFGYSVNGMELDLFHGSMAESWPFSWFDWIPKGLIAFLSGITVLVLALLGRIGTKTLDSKLLVTAMSYAAWWSIGISVWSYLDDVSDGKGDLGFGLVLVFVGGVLAAVTWYFWKEASSNN